MRKAPTITTRAFIQQLKSLQADACFNPYTDHCAVYDRYDAPQRRTTLLRRVLHQAQKQPLDALWLARDLGYRGGRRTGLPLTDDNHIAAHLQRWGLAAPKLRPTKGKPQAERTATVIWRQLANIDATVFFWNVFPLHPHQSGQPFSNRQHTAPERQQGEALLLQLIKLLKPRHIVAIGNDAMASAQRVASGHTLYQARHPSYGGQTQFEREISNLYG
ncbi:MAG TPA: uracil-DNA glycosylase [Burkholderiaceae bacterium]|nr:uracil-DNA glycosylase [Burkholderiaceae bacterium]